MNWVDPDLHPVGLVDPQLDPGGIVDRDFLSLGGLANIARVLRGVVRSAARLGSLVLSRGKTQGIGRSEPGQRGDL